MWRYFLLLVFLVFVLVGCTQKIEQEEPLSTNNEIVQTDTARNNSNVIQTSNSPQIKTTKEVIIKVRWKFNCYNKLEEGTDIEFPYTDVIIVVNEQEYTIGTYMGNPSVGYLPDATFDYPEDTLTSCSFWYAGAGDDIVIVHDRVNSLSIQWREKDEGTSEDDGYISEFNEIEEIMLPDDAKLVVEDIKQ